MTYPISVNLAVEDELSEIVLRKMLERTGRPYVVGQCFRRGGFGYLKSRITGFNQAAKGTPFLVLTDLDNAECPIALINDWLKVPRHHNLIFRVAVREIEAWLLADRKGIASYLGCSEIHIPSDPDSVSDPKARLIKAAERSRYRVVREDVVPRVGTTVTQGPNYNSRLRDFVERKGGWNVMVAKENSSSLRRTFKKLLDFHPI